jgi:membrane associated rhomboid family serine protease
MPIPLLVGFLVLVAVAAIGIAVLTLFVRRFRPFAGFVFFVPMLGAFGACAGAVGISLLLDGRMKMEVAATLAFYGGFLFCGAVGSVLGFVCGFLIWKRTRPRLNPVVH